MVGMEVILHLALLHLLVAAVAVHLMSALVVLKVLV
jgi:hypothetical protein